jgi:Leucine-rich repeat (LRR) protein
MDDHRPLVFDADEWQHGQTMAVYGEHRLPHLPIDVDSLHIQMCTIPVLDLSGLLDEHLETLVLLGNRIDTIINIPSSLKHLYIRNGSLGHLPALPAGLKTLLLMSVDGLENLDADRALPALPPTLATLELYNTAIHNLPSLPLTLEKLVCSQMMLTRLPDLPAGLVHLTCERIVNFALLPLVLPPSLQTLICRSCPLVAALPDDLPPTLGHIDCSGNRLERLPARMPPYLAYLYCGGNRIRELPPLPNTVRILNCAGNALTALPTPLPHFLRTFDFSGNPLVRYPHMSPYIHALIAREGVYFKAAVSAQSRYDIHGCVVFPPPIEKVDEVMIHSEHIAAVEFNEGTYSEMELLDCVLEIQHQVDTHAFMQTIKEDLMTATWHPRRVEAWCGVDFAAPRDD